MDTLGTEYNIHIHLSHFIVLNPRHGYLSGRVPDREMAVRRSTIITFFELYLFRNSSGSSFNNDQVVQPHADYNDIATI